MANSKENVSLINKDLKETLGLVREIKRNAAPRGETRIEANLEEELKRRRLTTNDPD